MTLEGFKMASMYPAIEAYMGRWTYYIVKIKFGDLAKEVKLSTDVHQRLELLTRTNSAHNPRQPCATRLSSLSTGS